MKKLVTLLFIMTLICWNSAYAASGNSVNWTTNYAEAASQAKSSGKPILILFTGSDWCTWCQKLEKEVFESQDFARESGDKFIFVKVDTPFNTSLPKPLTEQNNQLKRKYNIKSFPTVIVLDSQENQIGSTGYRQGGGKAYAEHLQKLINDYSKYHSKVNDLGKKKLHGPELKSLYVKALELNRTSDAVQIIESGIDSSENLFFLIEKYRMLSLQLPKNDEQIISLKQSILNTDPINKSFAHYQVAVIDFETACQQMDRFNLSPEYAVEPLISYIDEFGQKDPENLWRLEMIISQVYFNRGKLTEALKFAQASYASAPSSVQPDIATAIRGIETEISVKK